jgi:hypothetical protein
MNSSNKYDAHAQTAPKQTGAVAAVVKWMAGFID